MARRNLGFANPSGFMFVSRLVPSAKPITNVTSEGFGDSVFKWDITFYVENNQISVVVDISWGFRARSLRFFETARRAWF